jgi:xanthine dehydrogenase accessory factor
MDANPSFDPQRLRRRFALVLGTNEIASAVAVALTEISCDVVLSHDPFPPVIRRGMAFHDALFDDPVEVDGVLARRAESALELLKLLKQPHCVAVTPMQVNDLITLRTPDVMIDARMQKHRVTPDLRGVARLAVGLGPNFTSGRNCDIAIETHPDAIAPALDGQPTLVCDGAPRLLGGVGRERFLYAPRDGVWRTPLDVGAQVFKGVTLGRQDGVALVATMDGYLRGCARDGVFAPQDAKLIEIDPRGRDACWSGVDAYGRAIGAATVQALLAAVTRFDESLSDLQTLLT